MWEKGGNIQCVGVQGSAWGEGSLLAGQRLRCGPTSLNHKWCEEDMPVLVKVEVEVSLGEAVGVKEPLLDGLHVADGVL